MATDHVGLAKTRGPPSCGGDHVYGLRTSRYALGAGRADGDRISPAAVPPKSWATRKRSSPWRLFCMPATTRSSHEPRPSPIDYSGTPRTTTIESPAITDDAPSAGAYMRNNLYNNGATEAIWTFVNDPQKDSHTTPMLECWPLTHSQGTRSRTSIRHTSQIRAPSPPPMRRHRLGAPCSN